MRTTTGIVILIAFICLTVCFYKAAKKVMFRQCWRACCRRNDPTLRERHQASLWPEQQFPQSQPTLDSAPERVRFQDIRRAVREAVG